MCNWLQHRTLPDGTISPEWEKCSPHSHFTRPSICRVCVFQLLYNIFYISNNIVCVLLHRACILCMDKTCAKCVVGLCMCGHKVYGGAAMYVFSELKFCPHTFIDLCHFLKTQFLHIFYSTIYICLLYHIHTHIHVHKHTIILTQTPIRNTNNVHIHKDILWPSQTFSKRIQYYDDDELMTNGRIQKKCRQNLFYLIKIVTKYWQSKVTLLILRHFVLV